jgi:hypothetical protein
MTAIRFYSAPRPLISANPIQVAFFSSRSAARSQRNIETTSAAVSLSREMVKFEAGVPFGNIVFITGHACNRKTLGVSFSVFHRCK